MSLALNEHTLVLNARWKAIGIDTVRESIKKIMKESCRFINPFTYEVFDMPDQPDGPKWVNLDPDADDFQPMPEHPVILSAKRKFVAPRVVLLVDYAEMPKNEVRLTRQNILHRDGGCCQYCGTKVVRSAGDAKLRKINEYTLDHVNPRALGGKTTWDNIVTCCFRCNSRKANKTPEQANMKLKKKPAKPKWSISMVRNLKKKPECWDRFLSPGDWPTHDLLEVGGHHEVKIK